MADEIKTAQTNSGDAEKAPKESTDQQQAQKVIGEQSAAPGSPNPTPGGDSTVQQAAKPTEQPAAGQTTPQAAAQTPPAQPATPADKPTTKEDAPRADRDKTPIEKQDAQTAENKAEAAKAAGVEMLKLVVDGVDVEVPKGTLVIEACFRAGADVPYFCYHPRLTSVGACRMCLASVELEMFGQRRASIMTCCTVPAAEGMVIKTNTPDVKKAQNGILEFLLANHPLDCPICDRGGECPLQNMTIAYGPPTSRYIEEKRHFPKAMPISDYVVLDRERCIQCMRCTRFTEEISGDGQLSLLNRGAQSEIGPFFGTDFNSNFSGNTIEICPVGALTSRSYRFRGRPWEVKSVDSICSRCGNGCNIAVQHRLGEVVRINGRTNEEINEEWTCDRGKFGQYYVNDENRITRPLMRVGEELVPISWDGALRAIVDKINEIKSASGPDAIGGIASTRCTLEENYLFAKMMRAVIGTNNVDHQMHPYPFEPMQTSIAEIETFKTIVSVGMKLDVDQPIVYLRVFKAKSKKNAEWIQTERFDDTAKEALERARGDAVLLVPHDIDPIELGSAKAFCRVVGAKLNVLLPDCNSWGAPLAGASPGLLPGMKGFADAQSHVEGQWGVSLPTGVGGSTDLMLNGAAEGKVQMLYVMGADPAAKYINPELAKQAMATAFVVVQDMFLTETARYANIVLPACSFAEKDGTFVNIEGREQKIRQAFPPRGDSLPDWRILSDLMSRMGTIVPYFSARDIYREYRRAIPT